MYLYVCGTDFHATAYATNVYLLPGAKAKLVQKGQMKVDFEMPGDGKEKAASGGVKRKKVTAPSSDEESEWEEEDSKPRAIKAPPQPISGASGQKREVIELSDSETEEDEVSFL